MNYREVTKDEYDVLKKFTATRVKYYAQVSKPAPTKAGRTINLPKHQNQPVRLTTKRPHYLENTKVMKVYNTAMKVFESDPTRVIGRNDLVNFCLVNFCARETKLKKQQVSGAVSLLLADGFLKYV